MVDFGFRGFSKVHHLVCAGLGSLNNSPAYCLNLNVTIQVITLAVPSYVIGGTPGVPPRVPSMRCSTATTPSEVGENEMSSDEFVDVMKMWVTLFHLC